MCDVMMFPDTAEEFIEQYKIVDTDQVYTNGAELIPIFRMKQWLEHLQDIEERKTGEWTEDNSCSICGFQPWYEGNIHTLSFCPNCGARMEGDMDEAH